VVDREVVVTVVDVELERLVVVEVLVVTSAAADNKWMPDPQLTGGGSSSDSVPFSVQL